MFNPTTLPLVLTTCLALLGTGGGCQSPTQQTHTNRLEKHRQASQTPTGMPIKVIPPPAEPMFSPGTQAPTGPPNPALPAQPHLRMVPTHTTNNQGNPLFSLEMYGPNGRLVTTVTVVSGRAHTQGRNRHQAGTEAPLPNGRYSVARQVVAGTHPEVGDRFLPITPQFQTGRTALGFHYDPSFDLPNGEDGTAGCIATRTRGELDVILDYIHTHRPAWLDVEI